MAIVIGPVFERRLPLHAAGQAGVRRPSSAWRAMLRIGRDARHLSLIGGSVLLLAGAAATIASGKLGLDHRPAGIADDGFAHQMASGRPAGITARPVSEEKLAHVPGKTVTVEIVEFPPLAAVPEHHHAGSVTVYVLSGTVRSQIAGGPLLDYHVGETFFEPPGAVHVVAINPSPTEPAKFMAIHVADDGAQLTTYH